MMIRIIFHIALLALSLSLLGNQASAQFTSKPNPAGVVALHTAPSPEELPPPGANIVLTVKLAGSRDVNLKVRALIVRDGKVIDMLTRKGEFDVNDEPIYYFQVNAPLAELSYQFFAYLPDARVVGSKRFSIRRKCLPDVSLNSTSIPEDLQGEKKLKLLVEQGALLEQENNNYVRSLTLLKQLRTLLSN